MQDVYQGILRVCKGRCSATQAQTVRNEEWEQAQLLEEVLLNGARAIFTPCWTWKICIGLPLKAASDLTCRVTQLDITAGSDMIQLLSISMRTICGLEYRSRMSL